MGKSSTFLEMEAQLSYLDEKKTMIRARAGEDGQAAVPFVCLILFLPFGSSPADTLKRGRLKMKGSQLVVYI